MNIPKHLKKVKDVNWTKEQLEQFELDCKSQNGKRGSVLSCPFIRRKRRTTDRNISVCSSSRLCVFHMEKPLSSHYYMVSQRNG